MSAATEQRNRTGVRVRDVLDREFDRDLSLAALARAVHLSPDHLIRCFREVFGETRTASCSAAAWSGRCTCFVRRGST